MASTIQVQVDDELKKKSDHLFEDLGIDTTTAILIFLQKAVSDNGFPFDMEMDDLSPYKEMSEEEFMSKLAKSREQAKQGKYREANEAVSELRTKYGL